MKSESPATTLSDYDLVLSLSDRRGLPFIILGGQAVNFWANYYLPSERDLSRYLPFTSQDLDLFGNHEDLMHLAKRTGFKIERPKKGAATPSVGILRASSKGVPSIKIEILHHLFGMTSDLIPKQALLMQTETGQKLRVLDPISLLQVKAENSVHLIQNSPGLERQDVKHLRIMLLCTRAFLREQIQRLNHDQLTVRDCLDCLERVVQLSRSETAIRASLMYGIWWLDAFPLKELQKSRHKKLRNFYSIRLSKIFSNLTPGKLNER